MHSQKRLRGLILSFLHDVYPEAADEKAVIEVFYEYWRDKEIRQSLEYLADKGYVEKRELPHPLKRRRKIKVFKLLPAGKDLLEGTLSDEGILLEEE